MLRTIIERLKLPFRKDRELRSALYRILGFYPQNIEYYKIAFAHKSQAFRDKKGQLLNNERLEFLGDAVLESVVSDILFHHFEKKHEGFLTSTRSKIVQRESLNKLAKDLGIDQLVQSSTRNATHHSHIGGNAFEALMGAVYLDKGYKTCQRFIRKQILGRLMDLDGVANKEVNFKSKLLEWCQKNKIQNDFLMDVDDHDKQKESVFHCTITIEGIEFGYGKGYSKKEAQQNAAKETLTILRRNEASVDSIFRAKEKRTAMEANEVAVVPKIDEIELALQQEQEEQPRAKKPANPKAKEARPNEAPRKEKKVVKEPVAKAGNDTQKETVAASEPQTPAPKEATPMPKTEIVEKAVNTSEEALNNTPVNAPAPMPEATKAFPVVIAEAAIAEAESGNQDMFEAPAQPEETQAEAPAKTAKKSRRRKRPAKALAEFTQTELPTPEEVAEKLEQEKTAQEERKQAKRAKREAQKAKKLLGEKSQASNDEPVANKEQTTAIETTTPTSTETSNEAPKKLTRRERIERSRARRKQAKEKAAQNPNAENTAEPVAPTTSQQPQPKKRQSGNSRTRRRMQAIAAAETQESEN